MGKKSIKEVFEDIHKNRKRKRVLFYQAVLNFCSAQPGNHYLLLSRNFAGDTPYCFIKHSQK